MKLMGNLPPVYNRECTIDCVKSIVAQGILLVAYVEVKQYS